MGDHGILSEQTAAIARVVGDGQLPIQNVLGGKNEIPKHQIAAFLTDKIGMGRTLVDDVHVTGSARGAFMESFMVPFSADHKAQLHKIMEMHVGQGGFGSVQRTVLDLIDKHQPITEKNIFWEMPVSDLLLHHALLLLIRFIIPYVF